MSVMLDYTMLWDIRQRMHRELTGAEVILNLVPNTARGIIFKYGESADRTGRRRPACDWD